MPSRKRQKPPAGLRLVLTTLGGVELASVSPEGGVKTLFGPGKPLALLTYLAYSPGRAAPRERLLDLLWSDPDPDAARHALRQTLWFIRRRAGPEIIVTENGCLKLTRGIETDRDAFLRAVDHVELERAIALYRGDFLHGFSMMAGIPFEQWTDAERHRLQLIFLRTADVVVRRRLSEGRFGHARELACRIRDIEPRRETAWRLLIETLLAAGDPVAAGVEADGLERLLASEGHGPDVPTASVIRLAREMRLHAGSRDAGADRMSDLVGRHQAFRTITGAWEEAAGGTPHHVHVTGGAGIGKTRLLSDVCHRLQAAGARVAAVRAGCGEKEIPYAFGGDLASTLGRLPGAVGVSPGAAGTLVALSPSLSALFKAEPDQLDGDEGLRRRILTLAELLAVVTDEAPLALVMDDVQWMDAASTRLVRGLLGRLEGSRVLALTACRPIPEAPFSSRETLELTLEPLTAAQVTTMVTSLGALPADAWARRLPDELHRLAGGSPEIVLASLRLALQRGVLELEEGGWACPAPRRLRRYLRAGGALGHAVASLSPARRGLLALLSAAGTPLATSLIVGASGRSRRAVRTALEALEQEGLAARTEAGWAPGSPAVGQIVLARFDGRLSGPAGGRSLAGPNSSDARLAPTRRGASSRTLTPPFPAPTVRSLPLTSTPRPARVAGRRRLKGSVPRRLVRVIRGSARGRPRPAPRDADSGIPDLRAEGGGAGH